MKLRQLSITNQRETTIVWEKQLAHRFITQLCGNVVITADITDKLKADGHEEYLSVTPQG